MIVPNNVIDLPPPSPPKPKTIVLPPNWKVARDPEGKIYYYHIVTRLVKLCVCVCALWHKNTCTTAFITLSHCLCLDIRQTQWDPPTWEGSSDNTSVDHESEMDLGTPTYDENPSKVSFEQYYMSKPKICELVIFKQISERKLLFDIEEESSSLFRLVPRKFAHGCKTWL